MPAFRLLLPLLGLLAIPALSAEGWRLQYLHDVDNSSLVITDLQFPTAQRGMAVGHLLQGGKKPKPAGLVTKDGGQTWSAVQAPAQAASLFFLNEGLGWLVAGDGTIWRTTDVGQSWKQLGRLPGVLRVFFLDENRGWAVGVRKGAWETKDGGRGWTKLEAAAQPKTTAEFTAYSCIAFANPKMGLIAGYSKPPRRDMSGSSMPEWAAPESQPREWPSITVLLETRDGGARWTVSESSMFGQVTRIRLAPDGRGLSLIEFFGKFDWPAEVVMIDWHTGKSARAFRRKDRLVTDVALPPQGPAYLAAIEPPGALSRSPVPGKLKLLKSDNLSEWKEMEVDYRAVARLAILAAPDAAHVWVATDTGMILKLVPE